MAVLKWLLLGALALVLLAILAGQAGLLSGRMPNNLGVRDGRLKPPSKTPNSVSSQANLWPAARADDAHVEPLPARGDAVASIARVKVIVEAMPGAQVIQSRSDYLHVQFTTKLLKFVDDAEFWFDPATQTIQVRSASRVGRSDYGVNRARIEAIRAGLSTVP